MADGAKLDMVIAEAERFVVRLAALGDDLGQAWSTAGRQLAAIDQLGGGPMGTRFLAAYRPGEADLRGAAADAVERLGRLSGVGRQSVCAYDDGGARAASAMAEPGRDY